MLAAASVIFALPAKAGYSQDILDVGGPGAANAAAPCPGCNLSGTPTQSLKNPLIPGAASSAPYQAAPGGQGPPVGAGNTPWPVIPGDLNGPTPPVTGTPDYTHGNIFPARTGPGTAYPGPYVPGAGRHATVNGYGQGMYDFGQGQVDGSDVINNGGYRPNSTFSGPGGPEFGSSVINNGGNYGGTDWGPGGKNGGSAVMNNGGNYGGTQWGPGGPSNGTGVINNGGNMGGTGWGPGGKNGGSTTENNGGSRGGAQGMGPGGANGGTQVENNGGNFGGTGMGPGGPSNGQQVINNGGAGNGAQGMGPGGAGNGTQWINNGGPGQNAQGTGGDMSSNGNRITDNGGGEVNGTGTTNNGGPKAGAQGMQDRLWQDQVPGNAYDFQGPIPTARTFSRYLVILGVVFGTVFITLAGWGMVFGSQYGGARTIGAAGGLILLLMGYTIWKVVQMNTFHANTTGWASFNRGQLHQRQQGPQPIDKGPNQTPQNNQGNTNLQPGGNSGPIAQGPNTPPPQPAGPTFWPIFGNGPLPPPAAPTPPPPNAPNTILFNPGAAGPAPPEIPANNNVSGPAIDNWTNPPQPGGNTSPAQNRYNYNIDTPVPQQNVVGGDPNGINKGGSPPNNGRLLPGQPGSAPNGGFFPFLGGFNFFGSGGQNASGSSGGAERSKIAQAGASTGSPAVTADHSKAPHVAKSQDPHSSATSAGQKKSATRKDRKTDRVNRGGKTKELSHANPVNSRIATQKPEDHKSFLSSLFGAFK
jgi:hypothetical protein